MNFRTTFDLPPANKLLNFGDSAVLMGSCFSERIGAKLNYYGFDACINPFGTLFHPMAIAKLLAAEENHPMRALQRGDSWFTYESHSAVHAASEDKLLTTFEERKNMLHQYLEKSKLLVITLGTAWGYYLKGEIVANCHKMPSSHFEKKLTPLDEMHKVWSKILADLRKKHPHLEVLFTVSPVRHTKDGFIENQWSKARLFELIHTLNASYFPSYEIQMDDLRDYRFYEADLIHPNQIAVDYIFERFAQHKIGAESLRYFPNIHKFRLFEAHQIRPFSQERSEEHQQVVEFKRGQLLCQIPGLVL